VGRSLRLFGDGFQKKDVVAGRKVWRIPVMEGEFTVEDSFGVMKAVAGGNFLILAESRKAGLEAAEEAVNAIFQSTRGVILPFPGGVCRSGSKSGSMKYKLKASTNHPFCLINGLNSKVVEKAMAEGMKATVKTPGVVKISAGNYGGRLGPFRAYLKDVLQLQ